MSDTKSKALSVSQDRLINKLASDIVSKTVNESPNLVFFLRTANKVLLPDQLQQVKNLVVSQLGNPKHNFMQRVIHG